MGRGQSSPRPSQKVERGACPTGGPSVAAEDADRHFPLGPWRSVGNTAAVGPGAFLARNRGLVQTTMTRRRMRVLHTLQNLNWGGMERGIGALVTRTDADRFELHLLCLQYLGRFAEGLDRVAQLHVA